MEPSGAAEQLSPPVRDLVEQLLERMDCTTGRWRLEFVAVEGRVAKWFRHEGPAGADELARFDRLSSRP